MEKTHRYVTDFDSSTSMFFALSCFLQGKVFSGVGIMPDFLKPVGSTVGNLINAVSEDVRSSIYRWSGWLGSIPPEDLKDFDLENIEQWVVSQYPERQFPAITIGASNGAATHLNAALGIPWLPQTFLLSVRREMQADDVRGDAVWGQDIVANYLPHQPDLRIYQMHDPLQDRLMIEKMGYFRLKKTKLGKSWEDYIRRSLAPGGTIIIYECNYPWLVYRLGQNHTYQIGGLGGLKTEEYLCGSPAVEKFMSHYNSPVRAWNLPQEAQEGIEAEWGYDPSLTKDIHRFAEEHGYKVLKVSFEEPEVMSLFVADLYRWWYEQLKWENDRLLVECFALMEPYWALRSGCIPFWMAFNTQSSADKLEQYLQSAGPMRDIYLMLMSNGIQEGVKLVSVESWEKIISQASRHHELIGTDQEKYPSDFGVFLRYHPDLKAKIPLVHELPKSLTENQLKTFIRGSEKDYGIRWNGQASLES